jgi:hypothetical protein
VPASDHDSSTGINQDLLQQRFTPMNGAPPPNRQHSVDGDRRFSNNRTRHTILRLVSTALPRNFERVMSTCHSLTIHPWGDQYMESGLRSSS